MEVHFFIKQSENINFKYRKYNVFNVLDIMVYK